MCLQKKLTLITFLTVAIAAFMNLKIFVLAYSEEEKTETLIADTRVAEVTEDLKVTNLIAKMKKNYEDLEDYFAIASLEESKRLKRGKKIKIKKQKRIMKYYFKKPFLVRMEVTFGTKANDKGSEAIYSGGDRIKGHQGGFLSMIALNVNINSGLVVSLRGHNVRDSTMEAMIKRIEFYQENGLVSLGKITKIDQRTAIPLILNPKDTASLLELFPEDIELKQGGTQEVIYVDEEYKLPIKWENYNEHEIVRTFKYSDLKVSLGLPIEIFKTTKLKKNLRKELKKLIK